MATAEDLVWTPVKCSGCSNATDDSQREQLFNDADTLWAHITMVHVGWIPFQCLLCPLLLVPGEIALMQHYQQFHPGLPSKAIYTYEEGKKAQVWHIFLRSQKSVNTEASKNLPTIRVQAKSTPVESSDLEKSSKKQIEVTTSDYKSSLSDSWEEEEEEEEEEIEEEEETKETKSSSSIVPTSPQKPETKAAKPPKKPRRTRDRDASVRCRLCKKTTTIVRRGEHVWRAHTATNRFSCIDCSYEAVFKSAMLSHAMHKHKRPTGGIWWNDHTERLMPHYKTQFKAAFGTCSVGRKPLPPIRKDSKNSGFCCCRICDRKMKMTSKSAHIWQCHTTGKKYTCRRCSDYGTGHLGHMKEHATRAHNLSTTDVNNGCWDDHTKVLSAEHRKAYTAAFGSKAKM